MRLSWERGRSAGRSCRYLPVVTAAMMTMLAAQARAVPPAPTVAEGDRKFAQKSYAQAIAAYEGAQKAGAVPAARQDEIAYRVAVSLGKTQQWDQALSAGLYFVKARRGTSWEPRGLYWLGRLYLLAPHQGYRVGSRTFRGENVPAAQGDDKPVYVSLNERDQRNALDALEAAQMLYARRLSAASTTFPAADRSAPTASEQIQLDFDLIHVLQQGSTFTDWAQKQAWLSPTDAGWRVDVSQPYDPLWPQPKKTLYLYRHIGIFGASEPHSAALARFGEALWLRQYQAQMRNYAVKIERDKLIHIPYPYQDVRPGAILDALITQFPNDPIRDQAQYVRAMWTAQEGKFVTALQAFRWIVADRPHSRWASDARAQIEALQRPSVSLALVGAARPGQNARMQLITRNARQTHLEIYRLDLPALLMRRSRATQKADQDREEPDWSQLESLLGKSKNLPAGLRSSGAELVKAWDVRTQDKGDLKASLQTVTAPVKEAGAYVAVASVAGQRVAMFLPISDLVLVQKLERRGGLYYVTDAATGKPQANVNVWVRQWWQRADTSGQGKTPRWKTGVSLTRGLTNADGVLTVPLQRAPDRTDYRLGAVAWSGGRFAFVNPQGVNEYDRDQAEYKAYCNTDRAVYRPQQQVYFRSLLMRRAASSGGQSAFQPLAARVARVQITDPQGNVVYKQRTTCDAFGSVSGRFGLPAGAPLGEYSIMVTLPQNGAQEPELSLQNAGDKFRVEEYKKPEFEVTVTPSAERVRLGQPTKAKIHAAYYFGGPVPGASVTYRVYRNTYAATYRFPQPYDYLYNNQNQGDYDTSYRSGEVVAQGKSRLDAQGDATITFDTRADGQRWKDSDLTYTVEADVQDQSRRVISGNGALKATKHDVAAFLNFAHGYATQGDRVDVEVKTLNPSDQPVSVAGTARVYRQPNNPNVTGDPKTKETLVWSMPMHTDAQGHAQIEWHADTSGYFRIAFETQDTDGGKVSGDTLVWVDGPDLRSQRFLFQGVTLAVKNPYYQEGQTARVLLVTPEPGCSVLLTREVEDGIVDKRVVRIPGRSLEITVPVTGRDVPNVFLSAVMIRNGEMFNATQELFVPPVRQTARVTVQADKARYAPGEKARLLLTSRDWSGRPLKTQLSVAIADAALNYIQKDYAPDIRAYFYGDRRTQSIEMQASPQISLPPISEATLPVREYTRHELTLPDGMGQLPNTQFGREIQMMNGFDGINGNIDFDRPDVRNGPMENTLLSVQGSMRVRSESSLQLARGYRHTSGGLPGSRGMLYAEGKFNAQPEAAKSAAVETALAQSEAFYDSGSVHGRDASSGKMKSLAAPKPELAEATIRSGFRDTAFWTPAVVTDAQGRAQVSVTWPDNLTQWRAHVVGSTVAAQVGVGEARVTTKKDLLVQLETPRFAVERDIAVFSAIVHNDTDKDSRIRVKLDLDNADVTAEDIAMQNGARPRLAAYQGQGGGEGAKDGNASISNTRQPQRLIVKTSETWIVIPKGGQQRVDWLIRPQHEGVIHARMTAQSATDADAAQTVLPVLVHGVERAVVQSGALLDANEKMNHGGHGEHGGGAGENGIVGEGRQARVTVSLPALRKAGSSSLVVTLNPSLAGVMLDALPYLADYPYGCVEQTMSRFLPSVLVARSLQNAGYNLNDLAKAARQHRIDMQASGKGRTVANSAYTYPNMNPNTKAGAAHQEIGTPERWNSPVFDKAELNKMVRDGLARLKAFQHSDGGWGWWKDGDSDAYMSAYVVYGLVQCRKAGYAVEEGMRDQGMKYLLAQYLKETDLQQMAYQARVLALAPNMRAAIQKRADVRLYPQREKLSAYGKALLALALHDLGANDRAKIVLDNLENTAHVDEANGTANWDDIDTNWWRWYNNKVETNAAILQAYTAIAPNAKLPGLLVKWLVNNRRGASWHDTHDTSLAVNALAEWINAHQELSPDYTLRVDLGGRVQRAYRVTHQNALFFDNMFVVPDSLLQTGDQTLTITKEGRGACYYAATTQTFSEEEPIAATGNEIYVKRRYFRLIPGTAAGTPPEQPVAVVVPQAPGENPFLTGRYELLEQGGEQVTGEDTVQGPHYERVELKPSDIVNSGDLLEVELDLEAKNDYEYVIFEDMKPAGCEPIELRSGSHEGLGVYSNMELRDEKVAFFIDSMPQGRRVLSYRLRAETPGLFHALPTNGYAMYAPDVRAISDEARLGIRDEAESRQAAE